MLHRLLELYLSDIETIVNSINNAHVEQYKEIILNTNRANLKIRIRYNNGFLLEINEAIVILNEKIEHLYYRYHFQDINNMLIFRYDNAPHFPELSTFPHHKHLPEHPIDSFKPSIKMLFSEINNYLTKYH